MNTASQQSFTKSHQGLFVRYVILSWLIAGSLDALAAIFILSHGDAQSIFKFISSGIYGVAAFSGGYNMVLLGITIHYFIALCFAIFYFSIYKYVTIFHKNIFLSAILYGSFIYILMNVIILSFSNVHLSPRHITGIIKNAVILMGCIALPIVYFKQVYNFKRQGF